MVGIAFVPALVLWCLVSDRTRPRAPATGIEISRFGFAPAGARHPGTELAIEPLYLVGSHRHQLCGLMIIGVAQELNFGRR